VAGIETYFARTMRDLSPDKWDGFVRFLDARFRVLEEQLGIERRVTERILARGLQVIDDGIGPSVIASQAAVAEIEALRTEMQALVDLGLDADEIDETQNRLWMSASERTSIGTIAAKADAAATTTALAAKADAAATTTALAAKADAAATTTALAAKADAAATTTALAAKAPSSGVFYKRDSASVAFTKTGAGAASIKAGAIVDAAGVLVTFAADTAVTMPTLSAGTDYAIYVCTDGSIRADASFTAPTGYTTANSRQVGGFHYAPGGNATAQSGGDTNASINAYSMWDITWRPAAPDPRGMTLVGGAFWCDIYLLGVDHHLNGTSKYNVTIADGSAPPKVAAAFGGNGSATYSGLTWWHANECMQAAGKDLLSVGEFCAATYGTTEASSAGTDPVSTVLRQAYTSKWGVMLATGNLWVWSRDWNMRWDGAGGFNWRSYGEGRGQQYIGGDVNLVAAVLGGVWTLGAYSGSRAALWSDYPWSSRGDFGARGRCGHLRLV
jgi:hypothetical protein